MKPDLDRLLSPPKNALGVWLLVVFVVVVGAAGAATWQGWDLRKAALVTATLCYAEPSDDASTRDINCFEPREVDETKAAPEIAWEYGWLTWELKLTNVKEVADNWRDKPSEASGGQSEPDKLPACENLTFATFSFLPPRVAQNATYESYARVLEGCIGRDTSGEAVRLCAGTRLEADPSLCLLTKRITRTLYEFDSTSKGLAANALLIFSAVTFGSFQLASIMVWLVSLYRTRLIGGELTGKASSTGRRGWWLKSPRPFDTISKELERARRDILPTNPNPTEQLKINVQAFTSRVKEAFEDLEKRGDTIVQTGLLGTLTGMLFLFGSLERGNSAIPLEKQLALSSMLGSLGLAFGTTIFAILVRILFIRQLISIRGAVLEKIGDETSIQCEEVRTEALPDVASSEGAGIDLLAEGRLLMGQLEANDATPTSAEKPGRNWFALVFWLSLLVAIMAGLLILALTGVLFVEGLGDG
ncbi:MAG: MotA/TolQ/ExbB proton channel family protein [Rhizobiaceae bacterium]|nr:MotA/TolQ/ExbB proton channel family protein [Rhizobiaceae bacterium]